MSSRAITVVVAGDSDNGRGTCAADTTTASLTGAMRRAIVSGWRLGWQTQRSSGSAVKPSASTTEPVCARRQIARHDEAPVAIGAHRVARRAGHR